MLYIFHFLHRQITRSHQNALRSCNEGDVTLINLPVAGAADSLDTDRSLHRCVITEACPQYSHLDLLISQYNKCLQLRTLAVHRGSVESHNRKKNTYNKSWSVPV